MANKKKTLSQAEIDALLQTLPTNPVDSDSTPTAIEQPLDSVESATMAPSAHPTMAKEKRGQGESLPIRDPRLRRTMHLPVTLSVVLGEKSLPIRSLLSWGMGTQIILNREWQDAVNIKINGLAVGEGRVVIVGNNFGVEVTQWGRKNE